MGRILLAWELGGNYGHISMLLPIAHRLRQLNHTILFTIKDCPARQFLDAEGFDYVLSPRLSVPTNRPCQPASFADILAGAGFGDVEDLSGLITAWHDLFDHFQPTVLVAQYAPIAQFAARLLDLPCLQINTGFESPPQRTPFPCFRPYLKLTREHLLAKELVILENVNVIRARRGATPYSSLHDVLKSDLDLLATLPELDHYPGRRTGRFIGPVSVVDDGVDVQWPEADGLRIFVYLRPMPGLESILETLNRMRARVIAVIPGIDDRLSAKFIGKGLHLTESRVKMSSIMPNMDLAITHAGHGTVAAALLAGVPMLAIPTTIEQWLLTRNIERLGIGVGIKRARITEEFPVALQRLHNEPSFREKAKKLAEKYAGYDQHQMVSRVVKTIEGLPEWRASKSSPEPQGQFHDKTCRVT